MIVERAADLRLFLRMLAALNGQPVNATELGGRLKIDRKTAQRYLALAEQIFVVRTLPAWSSNSVKRLMKSPKLHFVDSGLAAMLARVTAAQLDHNKTPFGNLLESFVLAELEKQSGWSEGRYDFSHFRNLNGSEVDIVVEDSSGRLAGIEVKASATVTAKDFSGITKLADAVATGLLRAPCSMMGLMGCPLATSGAHCRFPHCGHLRQYPNRYR